ncbi:MAG: hypothetical protein PVSMB4_07940 [Ktedonobacterales bacterium]
MMLTGTQRHECPVCQRETPVISLAEAAADPRLHGDTRFMPPAQPAEKSYLLWPITFGVAVEVVTLAFVIVACGANVFSVGEYFLAMAGIMLPIVVSAIAFRRMLIGQRHLEPALLAWDEAMADWAQLAYCASDDIIFDPRVRQRVLSPARVSAGRRTELASGRNTDRTVMREPTLAQVS